MAYEVSAMIENIRRFHTEVSTYEQARDRCEQLLTHERLLLAGRQWAYTWTMIEGPDVSQSLILRDGNVQVIEYLA